MNRMFFATALATIGVLGAVSHNTDASLITNGDMELNTLANSGDFKNLPAAGEFSWLPDFGPNTGTVQWIGETRASVNDDTTDDPGGNDKAWLNINKTNTRVGQKIGLVADLLNTPLDITYDATRRANEDKSINHTISLIAGTSLTYVGGDVLASSSLTGTLTSSTSVQAFAEQLTATGSTSNTYLWLVFRNDITGNSTNFFSPQFMIDDVTATPIPEPGSLALMGLGGLCLLRRRRQVINASP